MNDAVARLRADMAARGFDACIVTNNDPHQSEYSAPHWLARQYVSGFDGSAGDVVVTADDAGLWTDGRYHLQAESQLTGSGIRLFKAREPDTPTIAAWLAQTLHEGARVACAGHSIAAATLLELRKALEPRSIALQLTDDLVDLQWRQRPQRSTAPVFEHPLEFAGRDTAAKLADVRTLLAERGRDAVLLSALPDVAWTLNLRGADVPFCPLVEGYLFVTARRAVFCVEAAKIPATIAERLDGAGVEIAAPAALDGLVSGVNGALSLCPQTTNARLYDLAGSPVLEPALTELSRGCKNEVERAALREALRLDGVAVARLGHWLDTQSDGCFSEYSVGERLRAFRSELPYYVSESFETIAGFGPNAALMHYHATEATAATVLGDGLLLVDSGGQYLGGTTDITRTFARGRPTREQCEDYTRVLQAVIRLTGTRFRRGTRGCNIDIMARGVLWQAGIDYDCGTGHGVGQCLVVHEGPHGLSQRLIDVPLEPGMVLTNEPGVYRGGRHGVRIENIMEIVPDRKTEFGEFLRFETLTLAPIDKRPLVKSMLDAAEIAWLDDYHARVLAGIAGEVPADVLPWLEEACAPL
ncbi:MAG: aminopeptidase P family protein [Pseudomonadota bacterium]